MRKSNATGRRRDRTSAGRAAGPDAGPQRAQGGVEFLDQATGPLGGARPEHVPRPQAVTGFTEGDTLVIVRL